MNGYYTLWKKILRLTMVCQDHLFIFMEKKYKKGYEKLLLESIKCKPTEHTVWMLNRILNDVNLEDRNVYMDVLKSNSERLEV